MGKVVLVDPLNDPRWDAFVEDHPFGWICHLSRWKQVLENAFKHIRGHYLALLDDTNNAISAAFPLFEVRSWLMGNRVVSTPFATLCDPLISSREQMAELLESAIDLSRQLRCSRIEIRTLASSSLIVDNRLGSDCFHKHHYLPLDAEPEQLRKNFHRRCVRQRITRAANSGLSLKVADSESDLRKFYELHLLSRKRLALPPQPYAFFQQLWTAFSSSGRIALLLAEHQGKTVASLILFKFKHRVSAEASVSDETFRHMSPNHFLFWEAIKLAYREGFGVFDFGRTSSKNTGLMDFKRRWGTTIVDLEEFYYPKHVSEEIAREGESTAYKCVRGICERAPDAVQPYIGRLCYRHLG